jgi:alpha-mannosidase
MENDHLIVEVDTASGRLARVFDKTRRREVLAPGGWGNALLLADSTGAVQAVDSVRALRHGGNDFERWIEVQWGWHGAHIAQRLVLRRDETFVLVQTAMAGPQAGMSLGARLDLRVAAETVWAEIPYGAEGQPLASDAEEGAPRWLDLSARGAGVSVLRDAAPGWEARGRRVWLTLVGHDAAARGPQRAAYALHPHAGDWRAARTARQALEFNAPMLAVREPAHRGPAGAAAVLLTVEADNVYVGAVKRAEVGGAAVVRLVEAHGRAAQAAVTFGRPVSRVRTATLLEDPLAVLPLREGTVVVTLRPWEIVTLLVDDQR